MLLELNKSKLIFNCALDDTITQVNGTKQLIEKPLDVSITKIKFMECNILFFFV